MIKKNSVKHLLPVVIVLTMFSSCGIHRDATSNVNQQQTSVILQKRNFKVVETVTGQSKQFYFLGIGGLSKKSLRESALSDMYRNADIKGKARAIVNVNVRYKNQFFPICGVRKAIASGDIIEFTE